MLKKWIGLLVSSNTFYNTNIIISHSIGVPFYEYVLSCTRCVDADGNKLRGSMGPSSSVQCASTPMPVRIGARSLNSCARALCAAVCEYGYKTGADGCPTCECDDPCAGFPCPKDEECIRVKEAQCVGDLCSGYPICKYFWLK